MRLSAAARRAEQTCELHSVATRRGSPNIKKTPNGTSVRFRLKVEEFDEKIHNFLEQMKHQIEIDFYENFRRNSKKLWSIEGLPGERIRVNVENEELEIQINSFLPFSLESFDFIELKLGKAKVS